MTAHGGSYFSDCWSDDDWYEEHWAPDYRPRHHDLGVDGPANDHQARIQYGYPVAHNQEQSGGIQYFSNGRDPGASGILAEPCAYSQSYMRHEQEAQNGRKGDGIPAFAPGQQARQRTADISASAAPERMGRAVTSSPAARRTNTGARANGGRAHRRSSVKYQSLETRAQRDLKRLSYVADYNKHWDSMSPEERVSHVETNKTFINAPVEQWCPCVGCRSMQETGLPCDLGWGRMLRLYKNENSEPRMLDARDKTIAKHWWSRWHEGLSKVPEG